MRRPDLEPLSRPVVLLGLAYALLCAQSPRADAQSLPASDAAKADYARRFVGFDERHGLAISAQAGFGGMTGVMAPVTIGIPYQGVQRDPLELTDFYEAVDRPDLAGSVHTRHRVRIASLVGGIVAFGASGYFVTEASVSAVSSLNYTGCDSSSRDYSVCLSRNQQQQDAASRDATGYALAGVGAIAVGFIGVLVWHYLDEDPESELDHRRLAREHNQRLKHELDLPADYEITPYAQPDGAGFALSGSF